METLTVERPKQITWDYDREADTLYISFGKPRPALTMDVGSGVLLRCVEETGKLVGFTGIGISSILKSGLG